MTTLFSASTRRPSPASGKAPRSFPAQANSTERIVVLKGDGDLEGWRREARRLLREELPPEQIVWRVGGAGDLFAAPDGGTPTQAHQPIAMPREAVRLAETALHHKGEKRFALLYRFLWRSREDRGLASRMSDPDTAAIRKLEKSVRRDAHKMHAFVRFRKIGEDAGRERYAAWFEPEHHIVEREAAFFVRRFANMDWAIVTPRQSAIYENGSIRFAPGGRREDVPSADAFEDAWRAYYASIFNPARIMTDAMRAEMPKKYWKNLPEASLIPELLEQAPARVAAMAEAARSASPAKISSGMSKTTLAPKSWEELDQWIRLAEAPSVLGASERIIPGEGRRDARLFFIGEQPGEEEDLHGRPFIGPAGKLLDEHLKQAEIDRQASYVTNAVKRFHFTQRGKRRLHQTPKAHEIDFWAPFLRWEHHLVGPAVTVCLGATALRGFFGRAVRLNEVRGDIIPLTDDIGGVCIPTFHPSYLLRIQDEGQRRVETAKFVADLAKARDLAFREA